MTTWTLVNGRLENSNAIHDLLCDGQEVLHGVAYTAAQEYLLAHAAPADLYMDADNPAYAGEPVGTLKARHADEELYFSDQISLAEFYTRWPPAIATLAAALLLILALLLPAPVQAHGATLYLPSVENGRAWFTQAEFEGALAAAGYVPALVTPFTWCELDGSANPPAAIRYSACTLELGGGAAVVFWREATGMTWAMVAQ